MVEIIKDLIERVKAQYRDETIRVSSNLDTSLVFGRGINRVITSKKSDLSSIEEEEEEDDIDSYRDEEDQMKDLSNIEYVSFSELSSLMFPKSKEDSLQLRQKDLELNESGFSTSLKKLFFRLCVEWDLEKYLSSKKSRLEDKASLRETIEKYMSFIDREIKENFSQTSIVNIDCRAYGPKPRIEISFFEEALGEKISNFIQRMGLDEPKPAYKHMYSSAFWISRDEYEIVKKDQEAEIRKIQDALEVCGSPYESRGRKILGLMLTSSNLKDLNQYNRQLRPILEGDIYYLRTPARFAKYLWLEREGSFLSLEKQNRLRITFFAPSRALKVFGTKADRDVFRLEFQTLFKGPAKDQGYQKEISLEHYPLRQIVGENGLRLLEIETKHRLWLDWSVRKKTVIIRGSREDAVEKAAEDVLKDIQVTEEIEENACWICLGKVQSAFRLSQCDHQYCKPCLMDYVLEQLNDKDFPIRCMKCTHVSEVCIRELKEIFSREMFNTIWRRVSEFKSKTKVMNDN